MMKLWVKIENMKSLLRLKNITAFTLDEFIEKVKATTNGDAEISNIVAIVVTRTISNP